MRSLKSKRSISGAEEAGEAAGEESLEEELFLFFLLDLLLVSASLDPRSFFPRSAGEVLKYRELVRGVGASLRGVCVAADAAERMAMLLAKGVSFWDRKRGFGGEKPWDGTVGGRIEAEQNIGGSECVHGGRLGVVVSLCWEPGAGLSFKVRSSPSIGVWRGEGAVHGHQEW